jgi:hypothetical protein
VPSSSITSPACGRRLNTPMASQSNGDRRSNPAWRAANPMTSRAKPIPAGNEEASSVLNLGEFQDVTTLTLSEAALVINALVKKRRQDGKDVDKNEYVSHRCAGRHSGRACDWSYNG